MNIAVTLIDGEMTPLDDGEPRLEELVLSSSGHAVFLLDGSGCFQRWSLSAERLYGHCAADILGRPYDILFAPEARASGTPERLLEAAVEAGETEVEGWRARRDGGRFWASGTITAIRGPDGRLTGLLETVRDRTRGHETEQALMARDERLRRLVEGVVDYAIIMLDPTGVVANWNAGAQRIKGYAAEEIVGRRFELFYTPEDRGAGLPTAVLEIARRVGRFESEGWRVRKDGGRFWASVVIDRIDDESGRTIGYAKITRDISDRRAAQDALAQSERQFRLLVGGVLDYALVMLDSEGRVANWNAGAQRIGGWTAEEIVGQHFSLFYTSGDRAEGRPQAALQAAVEAGRFEAEAWRVRKDGERFWANVVIDPIRDEAGRLIGFAKITRDITDRRNAQLELQRAQDQLVQAQKMEALGQLTGGVAHDFNNLLMVMSGSAEMLRLRLADDPRAGRALDAIDMAVERGAGLTRRLLSFSRRQRLDPTITPLAQRMDALRELAGASLPEDMALQIDLPQDLWPVEADQGEFDLALLNLVVNARDAMSAGGRLTIRGRNVRLDGDPAGLHGRFVALEVSDTGAGIPPDVLPRIFEPFFTTKGVGRGTGLGLSQVYGFATQAGGAIVAASLPGAGTTMTLYLPRAQAGAPGPAKGCLSQPDPGSRRRGRVLLVEDNASVAEAARGLLEQLGHEVQLAGDAAQARARLEQHPLPDLVFSDIVMPGEQDGVALARWVSERNPQLPVLLATGYSRRAEAADGAFPLLRKPYRLAELGAAIDRLLAARTGARG